MPQAGIRPYSVSTSPTIVTGSSAYHFVMSWVVDFDIVELKILLIKLKVVCSVLLHLFLPCNERPTSTIILQILGRFLG